MTPYTKMVYNTRVAAIKATDIISKIAKGLNMEKGETILRPWRDAPVSQVAARIGRSKSHIWRVLKGQRKPGRELATVLRNMGFVVEVA